MIRFTGEQKKFIYENYKGIGNKELTELFNKRFGTNLDKQIRYFKRNHNLDSGLTNYFEKGHKSWNKGTKGLTKANKTSFRKGNIPQNHKQVGYERINVDGYVEIKVREPNIFKLKHRVIYEQNYGPIPKNSNVIFADGNKMNLDPKNLILVTKSELLIMNKKGLIKNDSELTKIGSNLAKLIDKTNKVNKNENK